VVGVVLCYANARVTVVSSYFASCFVSSALHHVVWCLISNQGCRVNKRRQLNKVFRNHVLKFCTFGSHVLLTRRLWIACEDECHACAAYDDSSVFSSCVDS